jgi:branched-chain amino acid transport system substrate-binding protein
VFADTFVELGGEITTREAVDPNGTDFKSALTSIAATQPEFIYYPIFINAGSLIIRQAKKSRSGRRRTDGSGWHVLRAIGGGRR